jgi:Pvc16 N-terminal domain
MSNYKAIAVVTAALRNRLTALCNGVLSAATVTTLRPDMAGAELPTVGVNIFLYQVTPNAALRNADLPTRRGDGTTVKHPTAAIDLHYLLSFYGHDQNFETQILLGSVVGNLHADPSLSRNELEQVFSATALGTPGAGGVAVQGDQTIAELTVPNQAASFDPSGLADAVDLVRFTPTELSLEELSKLWSVFLDTPYVLSAVYQAGPVLIEDAAEAVAAPALPVMLPPRVHAHPFGAVMPTIEQVYPTATGPGAPITSDSTTLSIVGAFFTGASYSTNVIIDGTTIAAPTPGASTPQQLRQTIRDVPMPMALQIGPHNIQVTQQLTSPANASGPQPPIVSNVAGFVLQPKIASILSSSSTRDISVAIEPAVGAEQTVQLLLNLQNPPAPSPGTSNASGAYVLEAGAPQPDGSYVVATTGLVGGNLPSGKYDLPSGTYFARVQVAGIESPLTFVQPAKPGAAVSGPTGFTGPTVTLS